MTDFNTPTLSSTYSDILANLKARDESIMKLDYTSDTNLPTGTRKYNSTTKKFQNWSGSAWVDLELSGLAANAVSSASITADAVGGAKIRLETNTYLRSRNAAGSGDLSLLKSDASDHTILNAATGKNISLAENGSQKFYLSGGHLLPNATDTHNIGSASLRVAESWLRKISLCTEVNNSGGVLALKTLSANGIEVYLNSTKRWEYDSSGHQMPAVTDNVNLGSSSRRILESWIQKVSLCAEINSSGILDLKTLSANAIRFYINSVPAWQVNSGGTLAPVGTRELGTSVDRISKVWATNIDFATECRGAAGANMYAANLVGAGTGNSDLGLWVLRAGTAVNKIVLPYTSGAAMALNDQPVLTGTPSALNQYLTVVLNGATRYLRLYS